MLFKFKFSSWSAVCAAATLLCFFLVNDFAAVASSSPSDVDFSARQKNAGLRPGLYTVKSASTTTACDGSFLSYGGSGRVKMQSSTATDPTVWLVLPKAGTSSEYTLTPDGGGKAKLSYSKSCSSSSVNISNSTLLYWTVRYRPGGEGTFAVVAAGKPAESRGEMRCPVLLGCSKMARSVTPGRVASPKLFSKSSQATSWKLEYVGPVLKPEPEPQPAAQPEPQPAAQPTRRPPSIVVQRDAQFTGYVTLKIADPGDCGPSAAVVSYDIQYGTDAVNVPARDTLMTVGVGLTLPSSGANKIVATAVCSDGSRTEPSEGVYVNNQMTMGSTPKPLSAPTVATASGSVPGQVSLTATAPSPANPGTTLKVACVAQSAGCPAVGATWTPATGSAQQIGTLADGSNMANGPAYTCYSAEFTGTTSRVCSTGSDATTPLRAPTVSASSGSLARQLSVTATAPSPANAGTTLKVACVAQSAGCPVVGATWTPATGSAQQIGTLADGTTTMAAGTTYTCYSAEFAGIHQVCSSGSDATVIPDYSLDANGVTVKCPGVAVGATFTLGGVTYTKRNRAGLDTLVTNDDAANLATSCTTGVTDMSLLLQSKTPLNPNLSSWDTAAVTSMRYMFRYAAAFNQDISKWNTGRVTNMERMFESATAFNNGDTGNTGAKPLNWADTSKVTNMGAMFRDTAFNQDISNWNTGAGTSMLYMFYGATAFNNGDTGNTGAKPLNWADTSRVT